MRRRCGAAACPSSDELKKRSDLRLIKYAGSTRFPTCAVFISAFSIIPIHFTEQSLAVLIAIIAHYTYFVHGERDLAAARIFTFHCAIFSSVVLEKTYRSEISVFESLKQEANTVAAYLCTLFTSIVLHRLFFSPLRHVRGPLRLKITKLTHVWDIAWSQNCMLLEDLRKVYGDVVRTGPNEVTVFGTEAYYRIHGPDTLCGRAAYYDLLHPMFSLDTTRNKTIHDHRRKLWDQTFSIKSLEKAETMVYEHADLLCVQLEKRAKEALDISTWLEYYTFDLMGPFGFTVDFGNLTNGEHPILSLYHIAHRKLGPLAAAPWIKHLLMGIPYVERIRYYRQFMDWASLELDKNIQMNSDKRTNVIGYVLEDAIAHGGIRKNWNYVLGDFVLVIVAGSDPVRQVLANMMYYLIQYPAHLVKIRKQLSSTHVRKYKELQKVEHLNACVYETLRLNTAVPSAGSRLAPKDGVTLNGIFIPEGTTIVTPQYSMLRDGRNFERPEEWVPERFSTQPELVINKMAFVPWSIGKMATVDMAQVSIDRGAKVLGGINRSARNLPVGVECWVDWILLFIKQRSYVGAIYSLRAPLRKRPCLIM